jgi:hypothetical protein
MKAKMEPTIKPRRGVPVLVGNVYTNPHGRPYYKIVLGIVAQERDRPWNCVVMLHVSATGDIVGSSNQPIAYVRDHQDLMGKVNNLPDLKIEWFK